MKIIRPLAAIVFLSLAAATSCHAYASVAPEKGKKAIEFVLRGLATGKTVMTVSLRPGDEDLELVAYLRLGRGAELTSVYVTNGEALPSDCVSEAPSFLISRRKEEADHAMTFLDASAFFLNSPDPGVINFRSELDATWRKMTVRKLAAAIRAIHPQLVVVMNSRSLSGSNDLMSTLLPQIVAEAQTMAASKQIPQLGEYYGSITPWNVQRIWGASTSTGRGARIDPAGMDPMAGLSYEDLARRARANYVSRRTEFENRGKSNAASYAPIFPPKSTVPGQIDGGIEVTSARFNAFRDFVQSIARIDPARKSVLISKAVQGIDSLDRILGTQLRTLGDLDKYTLVQWKMALERLRFLALDVNLKVTISDSIVAQVQLFFVNVEKFDSTFKGGKTSIYFAPKDPTNWYVNEGKIMNLPLTGPQQFRMLTAKSLDLNYPVFRFGLASQTLSVPFSYGVYHEDTNRERRYLAMYSVPLRYTQTRIIEISTPLIVWGLDTEIGYRAFNASRDSSQGILNAESAICTSVPETVFVRKKDEMLDGSIKISWKGEPPKNLDTIEVRSRQRMFGIVLVKSLNVHRDSSRQVILVSLESKGAMAVALRRLYPSVKVVAPSALESYAIDDANVIVADRMVFGSNAGSIILTSRMESWVHKGGHLVVLQQRDGATVGDIKFKSDAQYSPVTLVELRGKVENALNSPNQISDQIWKEWTGARAWCGLSADTTGGMDFGVFVKRNAQPLVVGKPNGSGTITCVALNIEQQLENLHDGAFYLLANILSYKHSAN